MDKYDLLLNRGEKRILLALIPFVLLIGVVSLSASASDSAIPDWIKNNAKWWSEGSISEADYIQSLEYLITNGIINIPIPITEVLAAQTALTDDERAQFFVVHFSDGLIEKPFTIDTFVAFEATSSRDDGSGLIFSPIYKFEDNAEFVLESTPSIDKQDMYRGIDRWMNKSIIVTPFDVDIDVMSGDGRVIQTWEYRDCEPTAYGTYFQDITNFYQFSGKEEAEIRERVVFSCAGIHLTVP